MGYTQQAYEQMVVQDAINRQGGRQMPEPKELTRKSYKGGGAIIKDADKQKWTYFPMKVQDLNSIVQIKKKRPKMTFQDKQAYLLE